MNHEEDTECMNLMQWVDFHKKKYPELQGLFHIPNGGKRGIKEAVRFKAMGVKPGVPDYFLPTARKPYHGLWIEMKRPKRGDSRKGTISKDQREWADILTEAGYLCTVCWGWQSAADTLQGYITGT